MNYYFLGGLLVVILGMGVVGHFAAVKESAQRASMRKPTVRLSAARVSASFVVQRRIVMDAKVHIVPAVLIKALERATELPAVKIAEPRLDYERAAVEGAMRAINASSTPWKA